MTIKESSVGEMIRDADPSLYNEDLAPTQGAKKNWGRWTYAAIWMGAIHSLSTWTVAATMIQAGMSFWQAFAALLIVDIVVFVALIANSIAGTKYGTPFPVLIRAVFGHKAALIPIFIRGLCGVFWFGVFIYLASETIDVGFGAIIPGWEKLSSIHILGMGLSRAICYVISIILHIVFVTHGIERIKRFEQWTGPGIMVIAVSLVIWAVYAVGGISPLVNIKSTLEPGHSSGLFFLSMTGMIGGFATLMVNNPDLTRFARSQKEQFIGQLIGFPVMFLIYNVMSLLVTVATIRVYGEAVTDPIQLISHFHNPVVVFLGCVVMLGSIISVNAATNAIAVGFDLAAIMPRRLNFSRAGVIGVLIGVFTAPWLWYGKGVIINNIIGVLGSAMGPILGLMLVDFYLIRRREYDVKSLYVKDGLYSYRGGWNSRALVSFAIGVIVALSGQIIPSLNWLYSYNWFLGVGTGAIVYYILMTNKLKIEKDTTYIQDDVVN